MEGILVPRPTTLLTMHKYAAFVDGVVIAPKGQQKLIKLLLIYR
jgi:hypothetical protein